MRGYLFKLFDSGARPVRSGARPQGPRKPREKAVAAPAIEEAVKAEKPIPAIAAPEIAPAPVRMAPAAEVAQSKVVAPAVNAADEERTIARGSAHAAPSVEPVMPPPRAREREEEPPVSVTRQAAEVEEEAVEIPVRSALEVKEEQKQQPPKPVPQMTATPEPQRLTPRAEVPRNWVRPPILLAEPRKADVKPEPVKRPPAAKETERPPKGPPTAEISPAMDASAVSEDDSFEATLLPAVRSLKPISASAEHDREPFSERSATNARAAAESKRAPGQAQGLTIHKLEIEIVEKPGNQPPPAPPMAAAQAATPAWDWPDRRNWRHVR